MPVSKREYVHGWGHTTSEECISYRPEKYRDLYRILHEHPGPVVAHGLGRSYGDASVQPGGIIRTERLDHLISFDGAKGIVRAQAGVTLADLMDVFVPRGWLPPVLPGTRHVTLGGAVACNVHGKNHWREGDFAEHVLSILLTLASGETIECSPQVHSDVFWATAGGMGMTGIIEEVTLQLKPITSASLKTLTYRVNSIEDMIAAFEHYRVSSDYMVGWIDHMAKGGNIGRGVFESATHISTDDGGAPLESFRPLKPRLSVPFSMPAFLLNRYSMAVYNRLRFKKYSTERRTDIVNFNGFFHPLDGIRHWNRLYGRRGFFQYQCLLPKSEDVAEQLRLFLTALHQHKLFSFLAVIKYHRDGKGYLTFSQRGYSIALDFPNTRRVRHMLPQLDRWVTEQGGRTYLAKDATLTPELFAHMYGQAGADWCDLIHGLDPSARFSSLMSERLKWKPEA